MTRGRCSVLQLPEYNDCGLNVIILTLCGIPLSIGLQCKWKAAPYIGLQLVKQFHHHHMNVRLVILCCVTAIMEAMFPSKEAR